MKSLKSIPCKCGCGQLTNPGCEYIAGHNTRVNNPMDNLEVKKKQFDKMQELFKDEGFLEKRRKAAQTEERRELTSKQFKELWKDPEYRESILDKRRNLSDKQKEEISKKKSKSLKKRYKDPEYAKRLKEAKTIGNRKESAREKKRIGTKKLYEDPEYREQHLKWLQEGTDNIDWEKRNELMTGENNPAKRPEVRKKLRLKAIERINNNLQSGYQLTPFYNPIGCIIINEYGNKHGFNFQHAENGGEYHIKELGYWVDGYDKEKNTVIEVDEPEHFTIEGNLIEKDARRQSEIIEELKCDFIRIRVDNNNNILDVNIYPYNPTS